MFPILAAGSAEATLPSLPAFLVAHDGLYLRKRSLLGVSQTKVDGAEHLPPEKEYLEYALPKVPTDLMARVVGFFRAVYRQQRTEALVLLLWAGEGFDLFVPDQRVSPASVSHTLDEAELPPGSRVVGSIHSQGPSVPGRARSTRTTRRSSMVSTSSSATSTEGVPPTRRPSPSMGIGSRSGRTSSSNDHGGLSSRRRTGCGG